MLKKHKIKKQALLEEIEYLKDELEHLRRENIDLRDRLRKAVAPEQKATLNDHCLSICFDPWPLSEWVRLNFTRYNPGKYAQVIVGPFRIDWFVG